jgi:hypothetical protein
MHTSYAPGISSTLELGAKRGIWSPGCLEAADFTANQRGRTLEVSILLKWRMDSEQAQSPRDLNLDLSLSPRSHLYI